MSEADAPLRRVLEPLRPEMERVEEALRRELEHENPFLDDLLGHSRKLQGKRLRPLLLLYCARILGGVLDLHVALGAVVELLHSATLVHDDVLDEAERRRGEKALHRVWGNEASILLGDYLFAKAYSLCARLHLREANLILARTVEEMCVGELSQIATKFDFAIDEEQYLRVIGQKTASLFGAACRLGAVGHAADPEAVEALARYGTCLGTAFQIVDDCLDLEGDERVAGKSLGTDLAKGKLTLPVIQLLRQSPPEERRRLEEMLAGTDGVEERRSLVLRLVRERGFLRRSFEQAEEWIRRGKVSLGRVRDSLYVDNLRVLADYVLHRRA